tara:strand:+ start:96367 stop:96483 length:117 start_codon:yes stop_codon:yes gene_type:complete
MIDIKAHETFSKMVSLADIKSEEKLQHMFLVKNSKLSV